MARFQKMIEAVARSKKRTFVEAICEGAESHAEAARMASTTMGWVNNELELDEQFREAVEVAEEDGRDTYCEGEAQPRDNRI